MVGDLLRIALERRARADRRVRPAAPIRVSGADISARDNVALGLAGIHSLTVMRQLRDRGLIDDAEFVRVVYKFAGEVGDVEELLKNGKEAGEPVLYGEAAIARGRGSRLPKDDLNEEGDLKPGATWDA
jgi:hypothetical protein